MNIFICLILWPVLLVTLTAARSAAADRLVIFGAHAEGQNIGLSVAHFDSDTGILTTPQFVLQTPQAGYFAIHPDGRHVYVANAINAGTVSACAIDPSTGRITLINQQSAGGADPVYVCLDSGGKHALIANYVAGSIAAFPILPDGSLGPRTAFIQHTGHGVDPQRQSQPHPHLILLDPTDRFALVPDLGLDKVFVYRFSNETGTLTPNDPPFAQLPAGVGPRHLAFHPNGRWVYLVTEMGATIVGFNWDSDRGTLSPMQTVPALPADYKGINTSAEVLVHPSGRFLYASNRGPDDVAVFAIDSKDGTLQLVQHISSGGKTPRYLVLDPTGRWLIVANQDSNNAVVFAVDGQTGRLRQTGEPVSTPTPTCAQFVPAR